MGSIAGIVRKVLLPTAQTPKNMTASNEGLDDVAWQGRNHPGSLGSSLLWCLHDLAFFFSARCFSVDVVRVDVVRALLVSNVAEGRGQRQEHGSGASFKTDDGEGDGEQRVATNRSVIYTTLHPFLFSY